MPALAAGSASPVQPIRWSPTSKIPTSAGVAAATADEDGARLNHHESLAVHDVDPGASGSIAAVHQPALHLQSFADPSAPTPSALQPGKLMSAASAVPDHAAVSFKPKHSSEPLVHQRQPAQPLPAFSDNRRIAVAASPGAALAVQQASAHLHPAASSALQQKAALLAQSSADMAPLKQGTPTWEVQEPAAGGKTPMQPLDESEAIQHADSKGLDSTSSAGEPSSR